jgi:DNA-binding beta-propeller fold protein YncE
MRRFFLHPIAIFALVLPATAADTPTLRQTFALPPAVKTAFTAISPNGQRIAAACGDGKIRLWDVSSASLQNTWDLKGEHPIVLRFSADGALLAAGSSDGTLRVWDSSGGVRLDLKLPAEIDAIAFSPDGTHIAVAPNGLPIEVRDLSANKLLASLAASFSGAASLAFSGDGRWLASADTDTEIRIFDARDFTLHARVSDLLLEPLALTFSPDGSRIIAGGADGVVSLIETNTGKIVKTFPKQADVLFVLRASPDGKSVAATYFNPDQVSAPGRVLIWDAITGSLRSTISPMDGGFNGGDYAKDGILLLTSSSDKELRVWAVP